MQQEITDEITRHDADRPSTAAVLAVAQAIGVEAVELETCLNDVLDPDALDRMFDGNRPQSASPSKVQFTMANCSVVVHADGTATATVESSTPAGTST